MYSYRYINKHEQFGITDYTLILEDLDNSEKPIIRILKSFKIEPSLIDDTFLYTEARKEIVAVQEAEALEVTASEEEQE